MVMNWYSYHNYMYVGSYIPILVLGLMEVVGAKPSLSFSLPQQTTSVMKELNALWLILVSFVLRSSLSREKIINYFASTQHYNTSSIVRGAWEKASCLLLHIPATVQVANSPRDGCSLPSVCPLPLSSELLWSVKITQKLLHASMYRIVGNIGGNQIWRLSPKSPLQIYWRDLNLAVRYRIAIRIICMYEEEILADF